jgi:arylsulfatase
METIDDETSGAAIDFIKRQVKANKPFFCWWNATRMHLYTHVRPSLLGRSGISEYFDGMLEHDDDVGKLLKTLDDLGIANDTIVVYTTDNGPHMNSWPDGTMTPFRLQRQPRLGGGRAPLEPHLDGFRADWLLLLHCACVHGLEPARHRH